MSPTNGRLHVNCTILWRRCRSRHYGDKRHISLDKNSYNCHSQGSDVHKFGQYLTCDMQMKCNKKRLSHSESSPVSGTGCICTQPPFGLSQFSITKTGNNILKQRNCYQAEYKNSSFYETLKRSYTSLPGTIYRLNHRVGIVAVQLHDIPANESTNTTQREPKSSMPIQ